jgi:hypothetical protein
MDSLPDEILLYIFHYMNLYPMASVRVVNRSCNVVSKEYTYSSNPRIRGSLRHWATCFPKLKMASIRGRPIHVPDLVYIRHVETLDMSLCTPPFPYDIFSTFYNLKSLNLEHCTRDWRSFSDKVFNHLTGLTELRISDNSFLTNAGIRNLIHLEKLYLHNCDGIDNDGLSTLTKLRELDMYYMDLITDDLFKSFVHLTTLTMSFGNISTKGICHLKKLTYLHVSGCSHVNHCQGFQHLPLQKLYLTYCRISDDDMTYLSHIPNISLYGNSFVKGTQFHQLTHVESLSIFKLPIPNEILKVINLRKLKMFNMYDCHVSSEIKEKLTIELSTIFHTD